MKLNCVVVDDSSIQRMIITKLVNNHQNLNLVGDFSNAIEAKSCMSVHSVDLIFLDIEMPEQSGFDLIRQLQPEHCPAIVFVTAFHQHAVKAFEVRALDYLLKPVKAERLAEAIARVSEVKTSRADKAKLLAPQTRTCSI